jgi:hypothetical protein
MKRIFEFVILIVFVVCSVVTIGTALKRSNDLNANTKHEVTCIVKAKAKHGYQKYVVLQPTDTIQFMHSIGHIVDDDQFNVGDTIQISKHSAECLNGFDKDAYNRARFEGIVMMLVAMTCLMLSLSLICGLICSYCHAFKHGSKAEKFFENF